MGMKQDISDVRLRNTLLLFESFKEQVAPGSPDLHGLEKAFAKQLGISRSYWSQLKSDKGEKNIGDVLARRFERGIGMPMSWLDKVHADTPLLPGSLNIAAQSEAEADFLRAAQAIFRQRPGAAKRWIKTCHEESPARVPR